MFSLVGRILVSAGDLVPSFFKRGEPEPPGDLPEVLPLSHDPLEALRLAVHTFQDETATSPTMNSCGLGGHVLVLQVFQDLVDEPSALHGLIGVPVHILQISSTLKSYW